MAKKTVAAKKRNVKVDANGQLHVHSSFNNIIVSLANSEGQIISWSSAGKMGFRGSKKNTPYAAQMAAQDCAKVAYDLGLRKVKAYVKGPGNGRESAIRTIHGAGIEVTEIIDVTPLPHNGVNSVKVSLEQIKYCQRRTILPDSTVIQEREKLLNMVFNFVRNRKPNTPMEFWKNNSATCLRRQLPLKVLPVRYSFNCWKVVLTM